MFKVTFRFENGETVEGFAAAEENLLEVARKSTNPKTEKILYKRQFLTEIDIVFE